MNELQLKEYLTDIINAHPNSVRLLLAKYNIPLTPTADVLLAGYRKYGEPFGRALFEMSWNDLQTIKKMGISNAIGDEPEPEKKSAYEVFMNVLNTTLAIGNKIKEADQKVGGITGAGGDQNVFEKQKALRPKKQLKKPNRPSSLCI